MGERMTSDSMKLGVVELLNLMDTKKISAKEYAAELSRRLKDLNHLNSIQSFNEDLLLENAEIADEKKRIWCSRKNMWHTLRCER